MLVYWCGEGVVKALAMILWSLQTASRARFKCGLKRENYERAGFVVLGCLAQLTGMIENLNTPLDRIWAFTFFV